MTCPGYRRDLENFARLSAGATPFDAAAGKTFSAPKSISHRGWRTPARNQGRLGSCTGFGRSSGEEILNWIATGGQVLRLSAMYAYLENQRACGLLGADQGATIAGAVEAAASTGICRDEIFPYSDAARAGTYSTDIPAAAPLEAKTHLIRAHAALTSYDDLLAFLAQGLGVVVIGVPWTSGMAACGAMMTRRDLRGSLLGGHCMLLSGYSGDHLDAAGRPAIDLENSHGADWGDRGFTLVSPDVIDLWADEGHPLIGISDLVAFAPRKIPSWSGMFQ